MEASRLPGTISLLNDIDKLVMVALHDGKIFIGYLRTIDQFGNIVLHKTVERMVVGRNYCDFPRGIVLVRGENLVLCGEMIPDADPNKHMENVSEERILYLKNNEKQQRDIQRELRRKILQGKGIVDSMLNELWDDDM